MPSVLASLGLLALLATGSAPAVRPAAARAGATGLAGEGDARWHPLLAFDELAIEVDATRLRAADGPLTVWLRWRFADRAASPEAWDAGVRSSVDVVEVDCQRAATRTWSSTPYTAGGALVPALRVEAAAPAWQAHRAESVGGLLARELCALVARR
jgi:hypothetical protein